MGLQTQSISNKKHNLTVLNTKWIQQQKSTYLTYLAYELNKKKTLVRKE